MPQPPSQEPSPLRAGRKRKGSQEDDRPKIPQPPEQPDHDHYRHSRYETHGYPDYGRHPRSDPRGHYREQRPVPREHPHPQSQPLPPIRLIPGQPPPFLGPPPVLPQPYRHDNQHSSRPAHQTHRNHHFPQQRHHPYRRQDTHRTFPENQLPVQPLDRFKVKCALFQQPIEIGSFSYDEKRNFIMDDSQLKYYFPPDLRKPNNLSVNYEKYISRDQTVDEHIDALLDALICIRDREEQQVYDAQTTSVEESKDSDKEKKDEIKPTSSTTQADFICYRGVLTKIMCTPYARNEPWELGATLYRGSIYIEEHVSQEKRENAAGSNDRHKLMSYWGYRFETICNISKPISELRTIKRKQRRHGRTDDGATTTAIPSGSSPRHSGATSKVEHKEGDTPKHQPENQEAVAPSSASTGDSAKDEDEDDYELVEEIDPEDPELTGRLDGIVDTNLQYCTVARTRIGQNSVIMGAEVDCISEPKKALHNPLPSYIELKTSRVISNTREQNSFERHKLLKFWAQSFLPGIPTIIVGFRDDDGNVVKVETLKTMEIPRLVRGKEGAWDTTICINFLDAVFNFLRKMIVVDNPEVTYTIRWAYPFQAIQVEYMGKKNQFLTERFLKRWNCLT